VGRKILIGVALFFGVYTIVTRPEQAADIVTAIWNLGVCIVEGILRFFDRLLENSTT
jgi:hypothetical protein